MSKSQIKLAYCRLKTCLAGRQAAYLPILLMILILLLSSTTEIHPTIRYVSHTGTSTRPYTSWETAADSIQKAIDICEPGDTVLVANGLYNEAIYINKTINLWGSSMDSTIIDGRNTSGGFNAILYFYENSSSLKNFHIISPGYNRVGIVTWRANIIAENCRITDVYIALAVNSSSVKISDFIISITYQAISDECPFNNCISIYTNNILISKITGSFDPPVLFIYGGYPTFTNNILIGLTNSSRRGIYSFTSGTVIKNNLIAGFLTYGLNIGRLNVPGNDSVYNNVLSDLPNTGVRNGTNLILGNNILNKVGTGIHTYGPQTRSDYNLYWQVNQLFTGQPFIGDSNVFADPMFVKDTLPNPQLDFDYHLQAYSPAINKGNPNILDKDGTRSDIGMYGGPLGESYKYKDLAPKPPRNLSAVVDSNQILVKWNRNTEADTSHYNVYRDTVANFTIDSTKLISSQTDTFYIQYAPYQSSRYVYKITCVDNQGNESLPSEELIINITSLTMNDYPMTINDYLLYQNYPNPFNPSTTIAYKLKERAYVKLMVYDIKGELISVLVNKEQESGYYEVEFNVGNGLPSVPNNLASGIYLYRIEIIGEGRIPVYTEMKKMLMIK